MSRHFRNRQQRSGNNATTNIHRVGTGHTELTMQLQGGNEIADTLPPEVNVPTRQQSIEFAFKKLKRNDHTGIARIANQHVPKDHIEKKPHNNHNFRSWRP